MGLCSFIGGATFCVRSILPRDDVIQPKPLTLQTPVWRTVRFNTAIPEPQDETVGTMTVAFVFMECMCCGAIFEMKPLLKVQPPIQNTLKPRLRFVTTLTRLGVDSDVYTATPRRSRSDLPPRYPCCSYAMMWTVYTCYEGLLPRTSRDVE